MNETAVSIHVDQDMILPDKDQWRFRFNIHSETSDRVYVIAQHKAHKHWGCSCPAWRIRRKCKHLEAIGLPNHEIPYEAKIEGV